MTKGDYSHFFNPLRLLKQLAKGGLLGRKRIPDYPAGISFAGGLGASPQGSEAKEHYLIDQTLDSSQLAQPTTSRKTTGNIHLSAMSES